MDNAEIIIYMKPEHAAEGLESFEDYRKQGKIVELHIYEGAREGILNTESRAFMPIDYGDDPETWNLYWGCDIRDIARDFLEWGVTSKEKMWDFVKEKGIIAAQREIDKIHWYMEKIKQEEKIGSKGADQSGSLPAVTSSGFKWTPGEIYSL